MKTFTDNAGRTWTIAVNVTSIKRVRGLLGTDLLALVNDRFEGLARLLSNPVDLVDVIYCLCKEEADRLGVSDEDFGRSMGGDSIERATDAFLAEYTDFFPDPRLRAGIRKMLEKSRLVMGLLQDRGMAELEELDPDFVARKLSESSGSPRESSGSTPDLSPSANSR